MLNHPTRVVFLDLDGTLTKSDPGILGCVVKTYEILGIPVPDDAALQRFIGPAISESLKKNGVGPQLIDQAVDIYRRLYGEEAVFDDPNNPGHKVPGKFNNTLYDGIPEQLQALRNDGYYLAVATCKPEYQAKPICDHFGITNMVDGVYGASRDNSRIEKAQVLRYACESIDFDKESGDRALMVGDRWTDADGAHEVGFDCLGCGWGYAEPNELNEHGAYRVIDHVDELSDAVSTYFE